MLDSKKCVRCNENFWYDSMKETRWDYKGVTPTKITKCKNCGCLQAIKYEKNKINIAQ